MNDNKILLIDIDNSQTATSKVTGILKNGNFLFKYSDPEMIARGLDQFDDFNLVIIVGQDANSLLPYFQNIRMSMTFSEIIIIYDNMEDALITELLKSGVFEVIQNSVNDTELNQKIEKTLEHNRLKQELLVLRESIAMNYAFDNIVGRSREITKIKETIKRIAPTDIAVMINGPAGSGKELAARVIHYHSDRRSKIFNVIDCSTLTEDSSTDILFGNDENEIGVIEKSDGGTLLLKNVDQLPETTQQKVYRFLQENVIQRSDGTTFRSDIRMISSTTENMKNMIDKSDFSEELFFQLSVLSIDIPSLSKRSSDIEELVEFFLRRISSENNRSTPTMVRQAYEKILGYDWPGNIRELENIIRRAVTLSNSDEINAYDIIIPKLTTSEDDNTIADEKVKGLLNEGQRTLILKTLNENNWNFTQSARKLGIGRTTLWRKVKKYNLKYENA